MDCPWCSKVMEGRRKAHCGKYRCFKAYDADRRARQRRQHKMLDQKIAVIKEFADRIAAIDAMTAQILVLLQSNLE